MLPPYTIDSPAAFRLLFLGLDYLQAIGIQGHLTNCESNEIWRNGQLLLSVRPMLVDYSVENEYPDYAELLEAATAACNVSAFDIS